MIVSESEGQKRSGGAELLLGIRLIVIRVISE
jgi:hypothetical protein